MGRANVYLPDDLERRVRAAQIPISEVCQRALEAAVAAAEAQSGRFDDEIREQFRRGRDAGTEWASSAPSRDLLRLTRDLRFDEIPHEALPDDSYSLTEDEGLAWEAGFTHAARLAAQAAAGRLAADTDRPATDADRPADGTEDATSTAEGPEPEDAAPDADASSTPKDGQSLGDDAGCRVGETVDGEAVSFDPNAAVRADRSPLFAIVGESDLRARLAMNLAQDAAARGTAVVLVDTVGRLSRLANGLGKNVRIIQSTPATLPGLDELTSGAVGLGGLWDMLSGLSASTGLGEMFAPASRSAPAPGYVTVLDISGAGGLAGIAHAGQLLTQLAHTADYPRLVHIDLSSGIAVPPAVSTWIRRIVRVARQNNAALGVSAESVDTILRIAGSGSLLSTVFAFATSNPIEADRLRDLLGSAAPILLNPPGTTTSASDETWVVMRDLNGRVGQLRLDPS